MNVLQIRKRSFAWLLFCMLYLEMCVPAFASICHYGERGVLYTADGKFAIRHFEGAGSKADINSIAGNSDKMSVIRSYREVPNHRGRWISKQAVERTSGPGPSQPETQSFKSVGSDNLVDLFTGDFSYNIPLLDVGGYPVNLHYNSGITMEQDASWVGLGWNVNPGAINRSIRGIPDDFNGEDSIVKRYSIKDNKTVGVTAGADKELFGKSKAPTKEDSVAGKSGKIGFRIGVFHNSYNGWGIETGINAGINSGSGSKGPLSGGLSITNNSQSGLDISPSFSYRLGKEAARTNGTVTIGTNYNSRMGVQSLQMSLQGRSQFTYIKNQQNDKGNASVPGGQTVSISFVQPSFTPTISMPYTSKQFTLNLKVGSLKWAYHPTFFIQGSYSNQYIRDEDKTQIKPAYGYLYYEKSNNNPSEALLDINREKEVAFRDKTPHIAIPSMTYDIYSISGEGTGGMFRPYRSDIGVVYDHTMATKSESAGASLDLGFGSVFQGGIDINNVYASTRSNKWTANNVLGRYLKFSESAGLYENVYFKNPGERTIADQAFFDKIGDDKLVRVKLDPESRRVPSVVSATKFLDVFTAARRVSTVSLDQQTRRLQRDKRTQVISYLTASEAQYAAFDTVIRSYKLNSFPTYGCDTTIYSPVGRVGGARKSNHLSEVTVLGKDGKRHIYGIPSYNLIQKDVSFSVDGNGSDPNTGLVSYAIDLDNTVRNNKGKENFFNEEVVPGYAQSFLLSSILSPDYVDVTGDGITEDDNGSAVRFNYSRVYSEQKPFNWRAPFERGKANFSEGLRTYSRDDRGSYSFGSKEVWYLNSIESKTMLATFVLELDTIRKDGHGVLDENGGIDTQQKLYRLKRINLYAKSDVLKSGVSGAKPIKSVHFEYSYELCPNMPSSLQSVGKLTLRRVWFSYNGNYRGKRNPYVFYYHASNPTFTNKAFDRWGNYKDPSNNPGPSNNKMTNAEFPYSLQEGINGWDSTKSSMASSSWNLSSIKMPSGSVMQIKYESDDYAYVQNRRAMQMFPIAGFGNSPTSTSENMLHESRKKNNDYLYVFVRLPFAVSSKRELAERYFAGITKLYFSLWVQMPGDRWGSGHEQIPCYADLDEFDFKAGTNNQVIWLKLKPLDGRSPLATAAIQFLRANLPNQAYSLTEPGDDINVKDVIKMILSVAGEFRKVISGYDNTARKDNKIVRVDTTKCFVRLNNPLLKKYGGGYRVKRVEIFDNWQAMTNQQESTYGQEYQYNTTAVVDNKEVVVSSGVASYEPILGKQENPFTQPIQWSESMAKLGPTDYMFTEEPLGESFFPAASVGYSKVTVRTIHSKKASANGTTESEFYTAKDFPTLFEFTAWDDNSKKRFKNPIGNLLKFDAKQFVTLSQGFRIELNDMHGKPRSQSVFSQNDAKKAINQTHYYYHVDNPDSEIKHLNSTFQMIDSANGNVRQTAQMGKDIDIVVDVREQTSVTVASSFQLNVIIAKVAPPIIFPPFPRLPTSELNRFRSVAVAKVVNRYGILDSVVNIDKGSKISTRNAVYDAETGEVLVTRTQNEFNDFVYNVSYPAHWAYSGMSGAYKNMAARFDDVVFIDGRLANLNRSPQELKEIFESGDELILFGKVLKVKSTPSCKTDYFGNLPDTVMRVWAIDIGKDKDSSYGIYFYDKNGKPVNAKAIYIKIIRSGKRNHLASSVGTVTCLSDPIRAFGQSMRLIIDSTSNVIAASASTFKDVWQMDSLNVKKDTVVARLNQVYSNCLKSGGIDFRSTYSATVYRVSRRLLFGSQREIYSAARNPNSIISHSLERNKCDSSVFQMSSKTYMRFNLSAIPKNAKITSAYLYLGQPDITRGQYQINAKVGSSNSAYVGRTLGTHFGAVLDNSMLLSYFFNSQILSTVESATKVAIDSTSRNEPKSDGAYLDVKQMIQNAVFGSRRERSLTSIVLSLDSFGYCKGPGLSRQEFSNGQCSPLSRSLFPTSTPTSDCRPLLTVCYIKPCADGSTPFESNSPYPGYYCNGELVDTFVCSSVIDTSGLNPYRWGLWGKWQVDRNYVYYAQRKDSVVGIATNIRKDGTIARFRPFWTLARPLMNPAIDSTRWVWNSELQLVNTKGLQLQERDPLNHYNSVQYGYNNSLSIAVTQNAKNREMFFDGFEDYGYRFDTCLTCKQDRFIDLANGGNLIDTLSHSGIYSLRVNPNSSSGSTVLVFPSSVDTLNLKVSTGRDSTTSIGKIVNGNGNGLAGTYMRTITGVSAGAITLPTLTVNCGTFNDTTINFNSWNSTFLDPAIQSCPVVPNLNIRGRMDAYVTWTGYIQPRFSEVYEFTAKTGKAMQVTVNGRRISLGNPIEANAGEYVLDTISLEAGKLYPITIRADKQHQTIFDAVLKWSSTSQVTEVIPRSQMYTPDRVSDSVGTTTVGQITCLKPKKIIAQNATLKRFSLTEGTRFIVSAWVREKNSLPDTVLGYTNAQIVLEFSNGQSRTFTAKGRIIEGWQRIEDTVTIMPGATQATILLKSAGNVACYFDDVRIHPFSSNMKSYVYHPSNLRLMADLDENNYSSFYEYDDDGTLIRVKKETERGIKTIKESRSALLNE